MVVDPFEETIKMLESSVKSIEADIEECRTIMQEMSDNEDGDDFVMDVGTRIFHLETALQQANLALQQVKWANNI